MKVLIIDIIHEVLKKTFEKNGHECVDLSLKSDQEVLNKLPWAEILIMRSRMSITNDLLQDCGNLKIIGRVGAGLEHIDLQAAALNGIKVLSSPEGNRQAVAEHALGMLLSLFNKISKSDTEVRAGHWMRKENQGIELHGKTVGIFGFGNTGSAFAQILSGFGVNILAYDKYKTGFSFECSMERIWNESDVVSLHLPMTRETEQLVSELWLSKFQKPIYLVNTSRGALVKTDHLLDGLDQGSVLGACLDVLEFETENLKMPNHDELPGLAKRLFANPKVVLTPHTAGLSEQSYFKLSHFLADKILAEIKVD